MSLICMKLIDDWCWLLRKRVSGSIHKDNSFLHQLSKFVSWLKEMICFVASARLQAAKKALPIQLFSSFQSRLWRVNEKKRELMGLAAAGDGLGAPFNQHNQSPITPSFHLIPLNFIAELFQGLDWLISLPFPFRLIEFHVFLSSRLSSLWRSPWRCSAHNRRRQQRQRGERHSIPSNTPRECFHSIIIPFNTFSWAAAPPGKSNSIFFSHSEEKRSWVDWFAFRGRCILHSSSIDLFDFVSSLPPSINHIDHECSMQPYCYNIIWFHQFNSKMNGIAFIKLKDLSFDWVKGMEWIVELLIARSIKEISFLLITRWWVIDFSPNQLKHSFLFLSLYFFLYWRQLKGAARLSLKEKAEWASQP